MAVGQAGSDGEDAPPPLLHSLHEFATLIMACLDAACPRRILEIGSESGAFTADLCRWAAEHEASVCSIEPFPLDFHAELVRERGLRLVEGKSPQALEGLGSFDACIIDGDHNYWVVSSELALLYDGEAQPLSILHDVAWPCARRDQYYEPADIPDEHRHPFSYDGGIRPGEPGIVDRGLTGAGQFAYARQEGGPANGVLTAIEDFLTDRPDLEFLRVPCIFGLGFLFPREAQWADAVRQLIRPLHENELLARMERNRVDLFVRLLDGPGPRHTRATDAIVRSLSAQVENLQAETARLRLALAEQEQRASGSA